MCILQKFWFSFSVHLHNFCEILMMIWSFQTSLDSPEPRLSDWNTRAVINRAREVLGEGETSWSELVSTSPKTSLIQESYLKYHIWFWLLTLCSSPERNAHNSEIEKFCPLLEISLRFVGARHRTEISKVRLLFSLRFRLFPQSSLHFQSKGRMNLCKCCSARQTSKKDKSTCELFVLYVT